MFGKDKSFNVRTIFIGNKFEREMKKKENMQSLSETNSTSHSEQVQRNQFVNLYGLLRLDPDDISNQNKL